MGHHTDSLRVLSFHALDPHVPDITGVFKSLSPHVQFYFSLLLRVIPVGLTM